MDKTEYQEKLDELREDLRVKDYKAAYELVNSIDWRKVKSTRTLNMVADVYEVNKDYEKCRQILNMSLNRSSIGKSIVYRLAEVCIKQRDVKAAQDYYRQFVKLAPRDNARLILEYKLGKVVNNPIDEQIKILEEYKEREYTERWAYELALLYSKAGDIKKCVEACDDMILWFSEGKYVLKAMELKKRYKELTPSQQLYYDKEQRDSDARLVFGKAEKGVYDDNLKQKASVMDRMNLAGAIVTKDVNVDNSDIVSATNSEIENMSVTSHKFMGGKPDLKNQLEKSIKNVYAGVQEAPKVESKPLSTDEFNIDEFLKETQAEFSSAAAGSTGSPQVEEETVTTEEEAAQPETSVEAESGEVKEPQETEAKVSVEAAEETAKTDEKADEPQEEAAAVEEEAAQPETSVETESGELKVSEEAKVEAAEEAEPETVKEAETVKPRIVYDDREIPDPEPTPEEKMSRTIPLGKVGQNTVPISIEEVLRAETPEERRIRILNNAMPTKMSDLQRQIFTYFARVPGMDTQILSTLSSVYEHAGEHTSANGNIAVMGAVGTGKSRLSDGLINAMCTDMQLEVAKTARITGDRMNMLDPAKIVSRMSGGFLIIENASDMSSKTVANLNKAMEFRTDCMILIIEDEKTAMRAFLKRYPEFAQKFPGVISIPVFTNDELVTFARTYCAENNCQMDELGVLALYSLISNGQSEEHPMTISEVKEIIDGAISKSRRGSRRGRKGMSKDKMITLYEKDFS